MPNVTLDRPDQKRLVRQPRPREDGASSSNLRWITGLRSRAVAFEIRRFIEIRDPSIRIGCADRICLSVRARTGDPSGSPVAVTISPNSCGKCAAQTCSKQFP